MVNKDEYLAEQPELLVIIMLSQRLKRLSMPSLELRHLSCYVKERINE